jgi:hypothetical protein
LATTARPQQPRRNTPALRAWWAVALEKEEWMSALARAKVKVAVRKHSPTRTADLLRDVVVGVGAAMAVTDVVSGCSIGRLSIAVFIVTPFMDLRCKYCTLTP